MKEYVLDANALARYFHLGGGEGGRRVEMLFEQGQSGHASLAISAVNLGEVFYVGLRYIDEASMLSRIEAVRRSIVVIPADAPRALAASRLKHRHKLSYADSFAAALAIERNATLVSADPSFEQCGRALKWMRLPPFQS